MRYHHDIGVFPTLVGVFLEKARAKRTPRSLPHACGGVSRKSEGEKNAPESSPRLWGCFRHCRSDSSGRDVFPTLVGVFLRVYSLKEGRMSLPHACGGVSRSSGSEPRERSSSPRLWGCFPLIAPPVPSSMVFPTLVGVFLL